MKSIFKKKISSKGSLHSVIPWSAYRNLKPLFAKHNLDEAVYVEMILNIFTILHRETIVDWHRNIDVKRKMMNIFDDYLYDIAKGEIGVDLDNDEIPVIIAKIMELAENNFEIFS